jgi:hypothetical protein
MFALIAVAGGPCAANAAVLIKSFQFKICITGAKHPDGCKNVDADARVVVSDDAMGRFDDEIGQGATIEAVPAKDEILSPSAPTRRRRQQ